MQGGREPHFGGDNGAHRCPRGNRPWGYASPVLQDPFLMDIANNLTDETHALAVWLKVPRPSLAELQRRQQGNTADHPVLMLKKWTNKFMGDIYQRRNKLCEALKKVHRNDLARQVEQQFLPDCNQDQILTTIASHLSQSWYSLGIYLGLSADDLDRIRAPVPCDIDPRFEVLCAWRNQSVVGEPEMERQLENALSQVQRNDLACVVRRAAGTHVENEAGGLQAGGGGILNNATASSMHQQQHPSFASHSLEGHPVTQPGNVPEVTRGVGRLSINQVEAYEQQMEGSQQNRFPASANTVLGGNGSDEANLSLASTLGPTTSSNIRSREPMGVVTETRLESIHPPESMDP